MMMGSYYLRLTETDITNKVTTLVLEKLYDEYGLEVGDELVITKKDGLDKLTKIKI